jgi:hypothetical protein
MDRARDFPNIRERHRQDAQNTLLGVEQRRWRVETYGRREHARQKALEFLTVSRWIRLA